MSASTSRLPLLGLRRRQTFLVIIAIMVTATATSVVMNSRTIRPGMLAVVIRLVADQDETVTDGGQIAVVRGGCGHFYVQVAAASSPDILITFAKELNIVS